MLVLLLGIILGDRILKCGSRCSTPMSDDPPTAEASDEGIGFDLDVFLGVPDGDAGSVLFRGSDRGGIAQGDQAQQDAQPAHGILREGGAAILPRENPKCSRQGGKMKKGAASEGILRTPSPAAR